MKLAAIDIGSNSIHLVIVRAKAGQHLEIIDREKEMARLASGTLRAHRLSKSTIERAITTLKRYKKMAEANRVDLIITTATAAVRESYNAQEFVDRVRKEVGLDVELLPGVEEARLIAVAVSEVTDFNDRRALIIDIGGGSTEFIITGGGEPELLQSVRLGAVRLTEKFITTDPLSDYERERLVTYIRSNLTRTVAQIKSVGFDFVIGTSGTIQNMVDAVVHAENGAGIDEPNGFEPFSHTVKLSQIKRLTRRLTRMTAKERSRVPGLEKGRADIINAGGLLLETILSELEATEITSCDWSLREGVVLDYLQKRAAESNGHKVLRARTWPAVENGTETSLLTARADASLDVRARSVLSVARRYEYDAAHSEHVAKLATAIFDDTRDLHGLGEPERKLLRYAALLHDIGVHIAPNNHHKHSLYLIKNSEMPGFTASEIAVLATVVRYHRGALPKKQAGSRMRYEHEDFLGLDRGSRAIALRLAAILQVADGLDRSHGQVVEAVKCSVEGATVNFRVISNLECDLEIWSADRKARWFRDLFRVSAIFERAQSQTRTRPKAAALLR
ncbi:MAG TPA: Ppx/GppA phosphatase family protein [Blastocatellia bacterium]|nr:Ppx/GppA phosphatase family protein [Blastocatellia bacterium]